NFERFSLLSIRIGGQRSLDQPYLHDSLQLRAGLEPKTQGVLVSGLLFAIILIGYFGNQYADLALGERVWQSPISVNHPADQRQTSRHAHRRDDHRTPEAKTALA